MKKKLIKIMISLLNICVCLNAGNKKSDIYEQIKKVKSIMEYPVAEVVDNFDTIKFGKYEQDDDSNGTEDIEWIVVKKTNKKTLLLSKYILDRKAYQDYSIENLMWANCDLRKWLNYYFYYKAFTDDEKKVILMTEVESPDIKGQDTSEQKVVKDKVFCLSLDECNEYFKKDEKVLENKRLATKPTKYAMRRQLSIVSSVEWNDGNSNFWLRSLPVRYNKCLYVDDHGSIDEKGCSGSYYNVGVRPAMWVSNNFIDNLEQEFNLKDYFLSLYIEEINHLKKECKDDKKKILKSITMNKDYFDEGYNYYREPLLNPVFINHTTSV